MRKLSGFLIFLVLLFLGESAAIAEERILNFESRVDVQADGSLLVKETIHVRGERRLIKRGIYRDIPVRYRSKNGTWRRVGLKFMTVQRDGRDEPHFTERSGDYKRLYIGEKNTFLRTGEYIYEITYKTTRQLRFFKDFDELYWNVTGNKWRFPIDHAGVTIVLPEGATILQKAAYTGRYGQTGRNYRVKSESDRTIRFETIDGLGRWEGLTVAVGWQKGIVPAPSQLTKWFHFIWDNIGLIILVLGTAGIAWYYFTTWNRIGRDPEGGVIIPLFSAPKGLSPAAASYIHYRKFKGKGSKASLAFIAALVALAVKKHLVIEKPGDTLKLKRLNDAPKQLPKGEKVIFKKLLGTRKTVEFKQSTASIVQGARSAFRSAIENEHGDVYFKNNIRFFVGGVIASAVIVVAFLMFYPRNDEEIVLILLSVASAAGGSLLLSMGLRRLWDKIPGGSSKIIGVLLAIAGVFALMPVFVIVLGVDNMPNWVPIALGLLGAMNVVFYTLLHAPTELGRQIMDQLEGFKLYLSVAEADRMNMQGAPDVTVEVFERFLPYAIAMGVEKPWSEALESHLAKAGQVDDAYHPHWYHGSSSWSSRDIGAATAGIVGGVAAGMAEATPPSSSGSSGGGGGFSGGGGGGGGGGGW